MGREEPSVTSISVSCAGSLHKAPFPGEGGTEWANSPLSPWAGGVLRASRSRLLGAGPEGAGGKESFLPTKVSLHFQDHTSPAIRPCKDGKQVR